MGSISASFITSTVFAVIILVHSGKNMNSITCNGACIQEVAASSIATRDHRISVTFSDVE